MFRVWLVGVVVAVAWWPPPSQAENSVNIKSEYGQLVTSSTLRWVSASNGHHPDHAVLAALLNLPADASDESVGADEAGPEPPLQRKVYVCRAQHEGLWYPGQLPFGSTSCQVSVHGQVHSHPKYEVLENIEKGGRLSWVQWNKWTMLPAGAVAAGEGYVARTPHPTHASHLVGKLEINSLSFGKMFVITPEGLEKVASEGEVLVETEPVRYELTSLKKNKTREKVLREPEVLGTAVLANPGSSDANLDTVMAYDTAYSLHWGQARAMLKGLPTVLRANDGALISEIKWGIEESEERKGLITVARLVEAGTAVNVTLYGNKTQTETPYEAKLVAVYPDGGTLGRQVHSTRHEQETIDITPVFSQPYFLSNNSLVPTTTTTTTTTSTTTTTTTTTTTSRTTSSTGTSTSSSTTSREQDRKKYPSGPKGENSSMMNDEGKGGERDAGVGSSATTTIPLPTSLLALLLLLPRPPPPL